MRSRVRSVLVVLLAAALVGGVLAGCSLFDPGPPPEALVARANAVAAEVRGVGGVKSARAEVSSRDPKDHPADWVVRVDSEAADPSGLSALTGRLAELVRSADLKGAWSVDLRLSVPGGSGLAPVRLERDIRAAVPPTTEPPAVEAVVAAADGLRRLPSAGSVLLSRAEVGFELGPRAARGAAPLATAAGELRSLPGFGSGALDAVTVAWRRDGVRDGDPRSVDVSASAPSEGLVAVIDRLTARADVAWLTARDSRDFTRPSLTVTSGRPELDALALAAATDPEADAGRRPRTAFSASLVGDRDSDFEGYVGLPLASPEPALTWEQLRPATPTPAPAAGPTLDPAEAEQQVDAYRGAVDTFLRAAASASGTAPEPRIDVTGCDAGTGSSVQGEVLLPVWEAPDATEESVEAAFARITDSWAAAGLRRSDRAMGTDYWTPASSAGTVATLSRASIRGTTEGIRVRATSPCVG